MAEQDESSMIGYDPLAWLQEAESEDLRAGSVPENACLTDEEANSERNADESGLVDSCPLDEENAVEPDIPSEENGLTAIATSAETEAVTDDSGDRGSASQIVLEPVQNIQTVGHLHRQLQWMLDNSDKIDIDASAVTQIDTATLQLLLVLKLTAVKQHRQVSIDFPSEKFMEASNLLGLSEMLSVDQSAAGFF